MKIKLISLSMVLVGLVMACSMLISQKNQPNIDTLIQQSLVYEDQGDLLNAIRTHKEIVELQPGNIYSMNSIAGLYGKLGKYDNEIIWAKKALDVNPNFDLAYINYGNALSLLNRKDEARAIFHKALTVNPNCAIAYYSLGALADLGNFTKGMEYYKKAIELDPKYIDAYYNLGVNYANLSKFKEALDTFRKILDIQPNDKDAQQMVFEMQKQLVFKSPYVTVK